MNFIGSIILFICSFFLDNPMQKDCNLAFRGKTVHAENNEPIEAALIWIEELEVGTVSDINGNFKLEKLCPGTYTLKIQYLGHQDLFEKIEIVGNTNQTFRLVAEDITLEGVDIHGHQDALLTTNSVSSLSGDVLRMARGQNLGETLKAIPGVTTYASGASIQKPVIHGLHSNRILILNNGIRLEGQQWGADHAPEIDPFLAKEIAVVKGAETVRFGPDAMGGVILINPSPLPVKGSRNGEIDLIGFSNGRGINTAASFTGGSYKIRGLGYRIQGSGKRAGNIQSPDYIQDNTGLSELNFSGAVGYSTSRLGTEVYFSHFQTNIGILSDAHTGNLSDLESIIDFGRPFRTGEFTYQIQNPRQNVAHQLFKAKLHYHLQNGSMLNFQYGFQRNHRREFDRRRGELNERPALDMQLFTNTADFSYTHKVRKNWNGSLGLNVIQQANSSLPGTGVIPLIPNFDVLNVGFFAIEKFTKGPLELEGGLRYDHRKVSSARIVRGVLDDRQFTFSNFTAFIGGVYAISRNLTFNSSLGSAWRPPNINEQFSQGLHHGLAAIEIGNPDFASEQSLKWLNTLNYASQRLQVELTGYANRINNYIYLSPRNEQFVSLRGTFNVFEYLQADANLWGADLSAVWTINPHWELFSRSSVVRAENREDKSNFPLIPANRIENGITYELDLKRAEYPIKFSLSNLSVARQDREPIFDLAPAPPSYSLWNVAVASSFKVGSNKLNLGIQVNNLFDQAYKDYMNRFRFYTFEMGRNILIKLNYEF